MLRGAMGLVMAVAWSLDCQGQQPGWMLEVPWIQSQSVQVQTWSAAVLQCKHPSGWTWLASVVRSNRAAEGEISANMLTLTYAQTELSLSIRMSL